MDDVRRAALRERLAIFGHDLRNPLMMLTLAAETILATDGCSQTSHARLAEQIRRNGVRMARMLADLLDFTQAELGELPMTPVACDMGEVCRVAVDEVCSTSPDQTIALSTSGRLVGSWDRDRAVQAISHLVANAIVHGRHPITTRAFEQGDFVVTEVHDTGPPIPNPVLETLFDPYRRARPRGGLGLGLYIVQQISHAHHTKCTVESVLERGTTFRIAWPRA